MDTSQIVIIEVFVTTQTDAIHRIYNLFSSRTLNHIVLFPKDKMYLPCTWHTGSMRIFAVYGPSDAILNNDLSVKIDLHYLT